MSKLETIQQATVDGNVKIEVRKGKRIVKTINRRNTATQNLYYGLAGALTGIIDRRFIPNYICAGSGIYTGQEDKRLLDSLVTPLITMLMPQVTPIAGSPKKSNIVRDDKNIPSALATFVGVIPYRLVEDNLITELGLYGSNEGGNNNNSLVARLEIQDGIQLEKGQSLYVEWTFNISGTISDPIQA